MNSFRHAKVKQSKQSQQLEETIAAISIRVKERRAKAAIMAAKYAYVAKQSLWNSLKEEATRRIEECPKAMQEELFQKLYVFAFAEEKIKAHSRKEKKEEQSHYV